MQDQGRSPSQPEAGGQRIVDVSLRETSAWWSEVAGQESTSNRPRTTDDPRSSILPLPPTYHVPHAPPLKSGRVGLLAGSGYFPIAFAKAARELGLSVFCVGMSGMASDELALHCDEYHDVPLAKVGRSIRTFLKGNVQQIVMAGKIEKVVLIQPFMLWRLLPDWRALRLWFRYAAQNKKDDTILLAVIREFERDNLTFASALDYCPELLVKHGFLTRRKPTPAQWKDIHFGWELAKEMGRLDVGQSVMVKDTAVLAVEAIEGTDQCIRRAGDLCRRGGFTVVKVAKPQQDMRFDVPTIGVQTLHTMCQSGAKVLAVESDKTIVLDQNEVVRLADKLGIAVVALNADEMQLRIAG
ncbi:MAG: UDP-2,3-diacylglucosamine diphosphatase LpxI [Planctomycetales bacterium]|nr:UDP-2,3-diacylglucosamine diphosphatase LpxI [Planctomycetales bacterium]